MKITINGTNFVYENNGELVGVILNFNINWSDNPQYISGGVLVRLEEFNGKNLEELKKLAFDKLKGELYE